MRVSRRRRAVAVVMVVVVALVGGCSSDPDAPASTSRAGGAPRLTDPRPCADAPGFSCSTLRVPLDHWGDTPGHLDLAVAYADQPADPEGTLLVLAGGPGQAAIPALDRIRSSVVDVVDTHRLVVIDQRGTGATALRCPALQDQLGSSDLFVPTRSAVEDCAATIGPNRRLYGTADTVADLDLLRRGLEVDRWAVDGISYGSLVGAQYAIAHPDAVSALILDSVVPHAGVDPFEPVADGAVERVLADVCRSRACPGDPVADLASVIGARDDGSDILNAIVIIGIIDPEYRGVPEAIHEAAAGDPTALDELIAGIREGGATPAEVLSQGLHAATLCADGEWPWDGADGAPGGRQEAIDEAAADLDAGELYPLDRRTVAGNGILRTCQWWPPTESTPIATPAELPPVPTLLLAGGRDLSTAVEWLEEQAARTPDVRTVVVEGAGHGVQRRAPGDEARNAVADLLVR